MSVTRMTFAEIIEWSRKRGKLLDEYRSKAPLGERGRWKIDQFEIGADIQNLKMFIEGRGCSPGTFTRLVRDGRTTVMSDTDAEIMDFYPFVAGVAHGRVLVSGLGLGVVTQALLNKPEVESVTVIEIDPDVIALTQPHLACDRLTVVQADAREWRPARGQHFDCGWHDIWDEICGSNLPEMRSMKRRLKHKIKRQSAWCEEEARWIARQ